MKPPIEFRADAAPEKAAKAVKAKPAAKPGGQWVWVPDGYKIAIRSADKFREYQREYMRQRRAEAKVKA